MTGIETLLEQWCAGSPAAVSGPGRIMVRFPAGGQDVSVAVRQISEAEAELSSTWSPPASIDAATVAGFAEAATMMVTGMVQCEANATSVEIRTPLYLEGLSRQEFLNAVTEIGRAHWVLDGSARAVEEDRAALSEARESMAELEALVAQTEGTQRNLDGFEASVQWSPTHVVPDGGLPAWTQPDGSIAASTTLASGVELRLQELRGDWASVAASNGWTGWVDARRLLARA
jgi:hypothetical protein